MSLLPRARDRLVVSWAADQCILSGVARRAVRRHVVPSGYRDIIALRHSHAVVVLQYHCDAALGTVVAAGIPAHVEAERVRVEDCCGVVQCCARYGLIYLHQLSACGVGIVIRNGHRG